MRLRKYFDPPEPDPLAGPEVTLLGQLQRETDMAILLVWRQKEVWLPKSLIAVVHGVDRVKVSMPTWLATEKGLLP